MKIFVTKKDIKKGKRNSFKHCPIALSLKRRKVYFEAINEGCIITDGYDDENSEAGKIPLPQIAKRFIARFDTGNKVMPFSFKVKRL